VKSLKTLSSPERQADVFLLIASDHIRNYIQDLCEKNNYHFLITADLEELVKNSKGVQSAIVFIDYGVVNTYGARMYSRINVVCPGCDVILLCDQAHRKFIKEAMELGAYASILAPYEEWEVLTMIRNILTVKKKRRPKKSRENKVI
jgi:DNA-binding NtrC family response regulator